MKLTKKLNLYRYTARLVERLETRIKLLNQRSRVWSWARLLTFLIGVGVVLLALFAFGSLAVWCALLLVIVIFAIVVAVHRRLERSLARHQRWCAIKVQQLARMRLDWADLPAARAQPNFGHPYEGDLDLVGPRSVACLLDLSFTENGGKLMREWLTGPTPPLAEIKRRQKLVGELRSKHLLRMQLLVNAQVLSDDDEHNNGHGWNTTELEKWIGRLTTTPQWRIWLWLGWILAGVNIALLLWNRLLGGPALWPYSWIVYGILVFGLSAIGSTESGKRDVFDDAMRLRSPFEQLVALFSRLESYSYREMPEFKALCKPFLDEAHQPSRYLKRLVRIINATGMRGNPLIWLVLNLLAPWDMHFAYELDRCKADIAKYLPIWLDVWAEVETLNSLANLGYLNPDYRFPEVVPLATPNGSGSQQAGDVPQDGATLFRATEMAHPLLPDLGREADEDEADAGTSTHTPDAPVDGLSGAAASPVIPLQKVANDFALDDIGEVRLLTGSNMSGKSTFLRTIGVNMALAYAGAPVNAANLTMQRFRLFSSIKVTDSVTDGISYFYAEVKRLRSLLDALEDSEELPVFFFIDEIYRGTNNRERLVGSRAYIKALAGMNGVGLISTHDLDLVTLADDVPQIKNYHFRDEVRHDRMYFDYKLRPGPCPTTNALKIMAMEGLPAGEDG